MVRQLRRLPQSLGVVPRWYSLGRLLAYAIRHPDVLRLLRDEWTPAVGGIEPRLVALVEHRMPRPGARAAHRDDDVILAPHLRRPVAVLHAKAARLAPPLEVSHPILLALRDEERHRLGMHIQEASDALR